MKRINPIYLKDKVFFLAFSGCLMGFGIFLVLMFTFLTAYFSKAKATLVTINTMGEANMELFMIFLILDFFIICLVYSLKRIFHRKVNNAV